MSRIISVEKCGGCPHCGQNIMSEWRCDHDKPGIDGYKVIQKGGEEPDFIPDWCPLSEAAVDQCSDCPGRTISPPFNCSIPPELERVVRCHSGSEKKMEIVVLRCHHKDRVIKDAPRNREIIEEINKKFPEEGKK